MRRLEFFLVGCIAGYVTSGYFEGLLDVEAKRGSTDSPDKTGALSFLDPFPSFFPISMPTPEALRKYAAKQLGLRVTPNKK